MLPITMEKQDNWMRKKRVMILKMSELRNKINLAALSLSRNERTVKCIGRHNPDGQYIQEAGF